MFVFWLLLVGSSSARDWSPWFIDNRCPLFYFAPPYEHGFGDENVQFQFGLHVSKLLNLTFVFAPVGRKKGGHVGEDKYEWVMDNIIGINMTLTQKYVVTSFQPTHRQVTYQEAQHMHATNTPLPCNSYVTIPIRSCLNDWCKIKTWFTSDIMHHFAQEPKENCKRLHIETQLTTTLPHELVVFWSIRSGDVCYTNCDLLHPTHLFAIDRLRALTSLGYSIQILFHTQNVAQIDKMNPPGMGVKYMLDSMDFISGYKILEASSFVNMACQLYLSDIVIPSQHSSFVPMLLLYAVPNNFSPVLINECTIFDTDNVTYRPRDVSKELRYANILELLDFTS